MEKFIKKLLFLALGIGLFIGMERFSHKMTDGFALVNISSPYHKPQKDWTVSLEDDEKELLDNLFDQTFTYLNCGAQVYVFENESKEYVIKFIKYHHLRIPPFLQKISLPTPLKEFKDYKIKRKGKKIVQTFDSYIFATKALQKETGSIYAHLNPTKIWNKKLRIKDKLGIFHNVDLDKTDFIVQKKGKPACQCIDNWIQAGERDKAVQGMKDLIKLIKIRCLKGFSDRDPNFQTNLGFLEETIPFQIDIGSFIEDSQKKEPRRYKEEIFRITRPFRQWIYENHFSLVKTFDEIINEVMEEDNEEN